MPKQKTALNTVYISERLQECLRPLSLCALTTATAPMGYGKTTAVGWYLEAVRWRRASSSHSTASRKSRPCARSVWPYALRQRWSAPCTSV